MGPHFKQHIQQQQRFFWTHTSLATMVNIIHENLVFDDIIVYSIRFSLLVMVQKGFKLKIFTCKKMQVAENATRKLHFLLAFCKYASVNFKPCNANLIVAKW